MVWAQSFPPPLKVPEDMWDIARRIIASWGDIHPSTTTGYVAPLRYSQNEKARLFRWFNTEGRAMPEWQKTLWNGRVWGAYGRSEQSLATITTLVVTRMIIESER